MRDFISIFLSAIFEDFFWTIVSLLGVAAAVLFILAYFAG